jgi:hypothetical protein
LEGFLFFEVTRCELCSQPIQKGVGLSLAQSSFNEEHPVKADGYVRARQDAHLDHQTTLNFSGPSGDFLLAVVRRRSAVVAAHWV